MLYRRLLKLKKDTQSITNLEVAHRYLHLLEGTLTFHAQVLQRVFAKFGNLYTLLNVYNISEKLELAVPTRSSHSSSRTKTVHSATPILPSYNYCGNLAHKANECNIPSEDFFCDYCGKEGHQESICFAKFSGR